MAEMATRTRKAPIPRGGKYTVVKGDSLGEIASRIVGPRVTLDALKKLNGHLGPPKGSWNKICPGDIVNIPK